MACKDCIHYGVCWKQQELLTTREMEEEQECCENHSLYIKLPIKVGDTVYVPWRWGGQRAVATVKIEEIKFYDSQMHYMFLIDMESDNECFNQSFGGWKLGKSIGETVFLTKEEAEKALAERSKND